MLILALDTSSAGGSAALLRDGRGPLVRGGDPSRSHGEQLPGRADGGARRRRRRASRRRSLRRLDRPRIVHRASRRHRDDPGAGARAAANRWSPSRRSTRSPGRRAPPVSRSRHGSTRTAAKCSPRCFLRDGSCSANPRRSLPAAHARRVVDRARAGRTRSSSWGAARSAIETDTRAAAWRPGDRRRRMPALLAGAIAEIAATDPSRAVRPHALVPLYVRRPDAELARDRAGRR